jgi:hypothetical protein
MRRGFLLAGALLLSLLIGIIGIAVLALSARACPTPAGGAGDKASATAQHAIPAQLLPIYQQVGAQYGIPWEILAGIGTEECSQAQTSDASCTLQPGATGPGVANYAGASGLMQIGVGGLAGDAYDPFRRYLPNPALGPHDPLTSVELAALVLIKDKGAPTDRPIDAYLPYVTAYNGSGAQADAYGARVIADAHGYQGSGSTSFVSYTSSACGSQFVSAAGYVNPFAHAQVNASRIDQGVDFGGTGEIDALGPGRVMLVSTSDTGWGNGDGYVSYQLTGGSYPGDYVYVAEGITPSVSPGQRLAAGQPIGTFNGHSIEIGFALGQGDVALASSAYHPGGADTAAGRAMNHLLSSLGAPAGHRDIGDCGGPCPIVGGPVPPLSGARA